MDSVKEFSANFERISKGDVGLFGALTDRFVETMSVSKLRLTLSELRPPAASQAVQPPR